MPQRNRRRGVGQRAGAANPQMSRETGADTAGNPPSGESCEARRPRLGAGDDGASRDQGLFELCSRARRVEAGEG